MSQPESTFRRRARKVSNGILLFNAIGALIIIIAMIAFMVWLNSAM